MTKEKQLISLINSKIRKSPAKHNQPYQSDSEIIKINNKLIVASSDILIEEIEQGVFKSMYAIGWYSAIMTISDIMATGGLPTGLLVNLTLPDEMSEEQFTLLISGMEDCCKKHDTYILGGDTSFSKQLNVSTFGIGESISQKPIMRNQLQNGDIVYVTNNVGTGNLTAFYNLNNHPECSKIEQSLLPSVQPEMAIAIGKFATSGIDTSDGLLMALFNLLEQNNEYGLKIETGKIPFHPLIKSTSQISGIPEIVFTGGEVGDYSLLFAINPARQNEFRAYCLQQNLSVTEIGEVIGKHGLFIGEKEVKPYVDKINPLRKTPEDYIQMLIKALC
ncbi:MAG TPA: thiamine-phosphate kinase [Niabella sp.]|nr:thiamine-phosphate kinase [Niabella sp.]HQW14357.1 thiamine-phosphate kinase [Niabella sp.]HQX18364.1 thiamine-phosphate kinase [Niabella sp.]HQX40144.1 thiamine-phosphate kinase [Niabella sp.]HRB05889.1 thiamine-phosphate kinase [Niabella sp.]